MPRTAKPARSRKPKPAARASAARAARPSLAAPAQLSAVDLALDVFIAAPRDRVWRSLVEETTHWWPRDFYAGENARAFVIEPKLGGRMYEEWANGGGLVWATVLGVDPVRSISFLGHLTPAFGGPATTMFQISLTDDGEGTLLRLTDSIFGRLGPGKGDSTREGWQLLFGNAFKRYVEH